MRKGRENDWIRIYRHNRYFEGCYYRIDENNIKAYAIKVQGQMKLIGRSSDGISVKNIRSHRDELIGKPKFW